MTMTDGEITTNVMQAKDQMKQIDIVAELNDVSPEEIKEVLKSQGVDLRKLRRGYRKPRVLSKELTPVEEIRSRIKSLLMQRDGIDNELADLKAMLNELINEIQGGEKNG